MKFSTLSEIKTSKDVVSTFRGYNHNLSISDGEFYEMQNMTSSYYPALSPRVKRGVYDYPGNTNTSHKINGILSKDGLCYVDGSDLYVNDELVENITLEDSKKQLISMGAYLIILPDKKYVNTKDFTDYGDIDRTWTSETGLIKFSQSDIDGNDYDLKDHEPSEPEDKDCYIDKSSGIPVIKQYSASTKKWTTIEQPYVKIVCKGLQEEFENGERIYITGLDTTNPLLRKINGRSFDAAKIVSSTTDEGTEQTVIIFPYFFYGTVMPSQYGQITISSIMPKMDFVIESNNRLWGCRYGKNLQDDFVNEIYACKLGDFRRWYTFSGTSMDSYTASCGTDGPFTGAILHLGKPIFFKENCIHKVYGSYPAEYQIQTTTCKGVMKGAANSIAIVNESVIYKSRSGICIFDGSVPSEVSSALGEIKYTGVDSNKDELINGAVAGFINNKYYISMKSEVDNEWYLFAFDTSTGIWCKEDNTRADYFCTHNGELFYVDNKDDEIKTILGSCTKDETPIDWMVETGVIGTTIKSGKYTSSQLTGKKYISQLLIRILIEFDTSVYFYIQYDSSGDWEHLTTIKGTTTKSVTVPVKPKRCDHFRIKIIGEGEAKIFSIAKSIEQGSDY